MATIGLNRKSTAIRCRGAQSCLMGSSNLRRRGWLFDSEGWVSFLAVYLSFIGHGGIEGTTDENIDWALGEAESQVPELSSIEVEVVRVKLKRATLPSEKSPRTVATSPRTAVDLSGTQIQDDNFSNALWFVQRHLASMGLRSTNRRFNRRKKRSAAPLLDSSGYIYEQDASVDFGRLSFMYRHGLACRHSPQPPRLNLTNPS